MTLLIIPSKVTTPLIVPKTGDVSALLILFFFLWWFVYVLIESFIQVRRRRLTIVLSSLAALALMYVGCMAFLFRVDVIACVDHCAVFMLGGGEDFVMCVFILIMVSM